MYIAYRPSMNRKANNRQSNKGANVASLMNKAMLITMQVGQLLFGVVYLAFSIGMFFMFAWFVVIFFEVLARF